MCSLEDNTNHHQNLFYMLRTISMRAVLLLLMTALCSNVHGQTEAHTAFRTQMSNVFSSLEKNRVPHGLLLDYAYDAAELSNYKGVLTDTNKVSRATLRDLYTTVLTSAIHSNAGGFYSVNYIDSLWQTQRQPGIITIGGIYYQYARFKDNAVTGNMLTVNANKFIDKYIGGVWQNPYQTERVFAMSPASHTYKGKSFNVVMPANLWLTNQSANIHSISINFGDGVGYRTITPGQQITLTYADTGQKVWTFRLRLTNNTYLYSHTDIQVLQAPNPYFPGASPAAGQFMRVGGPTLLTANDSYLGQAAQGWVTVSYANEDRVMRKPLIVVEGFDPGHLISPELEFGVTDYNSFNEQISSLPISHNLRTILSGANQQYDIIYIDWKNGTDYLQRNAYLLQKVIQWVNAEKAAANITEPNVVLGQSMGGVIARWALKDMEQRSLGHQTRLYISWDAPHQGANIPPAYQHAVRHLQNLYMGTLVPNLLGGTQQFSIIENLLNLLDEPAAKQMIKNRLNINGNIDNATHSTWQNALKAKGYPLQSRNVAVSNGAECGLDLGFQPGSTLLSIHGKGNTRFLTDLLLIPGLFGPILGNLSSIISVITLKPQFLLGVIPGKSTLSFDFLCRAQPVNATTQIYRGKITYTKTILWLVNVNTTITNRTKNAVTSVLAIDGLAGGYYQLPVDFGSTAMQNVLIKYNATISGQPNFNFIPVVSALDIGGGNVTLQLADYKQKYRGSSPPLAPKASPFHSFITADFDNSFGRNEAHIDIKARNGDWTTAELNDAPAPAPVSCCPVDLPISINGAQNFCGSSSYTIQNLPVDYTSIFWFVSPPSGVVNIVSGSQFQPTLQLNKVGVGPLTISVFVTRECEDLSSSRVITVGTPGPTEIVPAAVGYGNLQPATVYPFTTIPFNTPSELNISNFQWQVLFGGSVYNNTGGNQYGQILTDALAPFQYEKDISVRFRWQGCEWSPWVLYSGKIVSNGGQDPLEPLFAVVPNPSSSDIAIVQHLSADNLLSSAKSSEPESEKKKIEWLRITDMQGGQKLYHDYSKMEVTEIDRINVSAYISGQYVAHIFDGEKLYQVSFTVKH